MIDGKWIEENEEKIPRGRVRTRFAPSPTGYMHVGGLRTALYAYLIAKKSGGDFILRIEDTDTARFVEGATEIIIKTLRDAGIEYDEGPDAEGSAGPYIQSERKELYRPYAELMCEKGAAYYCFCAHTAHDEREHDGVVSGVADPCREVLYEESLCRVRSGASHVIRLKTPREGETSFNDMIFGTITVENKTLDDMVLLKSDNMPTYNFANIIDDHLMGITHVLRGDEYLASTPKYNLVYKALGWEIPSYITVSQIMRDSRHKFSKRRGDPTYDDLLNQGYLPGAVLNYVALLGWSPGGEREIFSLYELRDVFDISGISKSPALFDIVKLNYFNSEYIRAMTDEEFCKAAEPHIRKAVPNTAYSALEIAKILKARCERLSDIPEKIDFIEKLPEYETELFIHKKSKTDEKTSHAMLKSAYKTLGALTDWTAETIHDSLKSLAEELEVKNATLMWPVRIAVSGKAVTPGGAVEICAILGKQETLQRIETGMEKLS